MKKQTPFEKASYTKDTKFKCLVSYLQFNKGDIVTLDYDDGTLSPIFVDSKGNKHFMTIPTSKEAELEVYIETETVKTKKLKFPCCVPTSQIKDEATLNKLIDLFVANGADKHETNYPSVAVWGNFGVDYGNGTMFFDYVSNYSEEDKESDVTIYSVEELLAPVAEEVPVVRVKVEPTLLPVGAEVKIAESSKYYSIDTECNPKDTRGMLLRNESKTGDDFHYQVKWSNGCINSYKLNDLVLWEDSTSVASCEALTDDSEDKPSVGIDSSDSGYKEPTEPLVSITKDVKYYVSIKNTLFTFTQDQLNELVSELEGFVDYE